MQFLIVKDILDLGCGHTSCKDCWRQYLMQQIVEDGKSDLIRCPATKCGVVVDDVTVMQLLCDEKAKQKYQYLMTNSFVEVKMFYEQIFLFFYSYL